jgi:hypothetical protein
MGGSNLWEKPNGWMVYFMNPKEKWTIWGYRHELETPILGHD